MQSFDAGIGGEVVLQRGEEPAGWKKENHPSYMSLCYVAREGFVGISNGGGEASCIYGDPNYRGSTVHTYIRNLSYIVRT